MKFLIKNSSDWTEFLLNFKWTETSKKPESLAIWFIESITRLASQSSNESLIQLKNNFFKVSEMKLRLKMSLKLNSNNF
jgi:hypothetical protein